MPPAVSGIEDAFREDAIVGSPMEQTVLAPNCRRLLAIDEICERFEDELRRGAGPRIEAAIAADWRGDDRTELLTYLLQVEVEHRLQRGELISTDDYADRFPECRGTIATLVQHAIRCLLPKEIGPYRIVGRLGAGGMGEVYKAFQPHLKRLVAIKVLPSALLNQPEAQRRFEREMQAAGQVVHPNIVTAFDAGQTADGHYLAMELVDGYSLAEISRRLGPLDVPCACELIRQAAAGLAQVHRAGLIHRDVKPGNVMLGSLGQVKVLDLGLALLAERPGADAGAELTESSHMLGTLGYMAPEQCIDSYRVDAKADLYALGATLYRLLAGRVPFAGREATMVGRFPTKFRESCTPIQTLRPDVPAPLAALIEQMLAREPKDRPAGAEEVMRQLAPSCAGADLAGLFERASRAIEPAASRDTAAGGPTVSNRSERRAFPSPPPSPPAGLTWTWLLAPLGAMLVLGAVLFLQTRTGTLRVELLGGKVVVRDEGRELGSQTLPPAKPAEPNPRLPAIPLPRPSPSMLRTSPNANSTDKQLAEYLQRIGGIPRTSTGNMTDPNLKLEGILWHQGDDAVDENLALFVNLKHVEHLSLQSRRITHQGFAYCKGFSGLKRLELSYSGIDGDGAGQLADYPLLEFLQPPYLGADAWLAAAAKQSRLRELFLYRCAVTDEGLKPLIGMAQLKQLVIVECRSLTPQAATHLAQLRQLESLVVGKTPGIDDDPAAIARLRQALPGVKVNE